MTDTEVVASEPSRRGTFLVLALVTALVATVVGIRLYATRERPLPHEPPGGAYLVIDRGRPRFENNGARGYLFTARSVWPDPLRVESVVPLDASGAEAPYRSSGVFEGTGYGQSQFLGLEPPAPGPYVVQPGSEASVGLWVPVRCERTVRVVALRVRLLLTRSRAEQVIGLGPPESSPVESGTGCATPSPGG
ncbi:MAG TPA: hypothetical protein VNQ77_15920 [Frankiaceae bacterium]|nr:hypothetical protein [Frankiaceae bacterium]